MTPTPRFRRHAIRTAALAAALACPLLAAAQSAAPPAGYEMARVVSSTPVVQQVNEPQQVCTNTPVARQPSGAGALLGAVAGGVVGNAIGAGSGNAAATALGVVGGAMLGDRVEAGNSAPYYVPDCGTQLVTRSISVYNVVYEYAGKQYSVVLPSDPGPTLAVQVAPAALSVPAPTQPVLVSAPPLYVAPPAYGYAYPYAAPYPYRYWAPVGINLGFGYYRHSHHR